MKLREHYQVNEIFNSVQGEGILTGAPATFIRLQGCTVGCVWCDTKYTWAAGGTRMKVYDIIDQAHHRHIVLTGGEPTLYDLDGLLVRLQAEGHFVQLETSGQNDIRGSVYPDWITWSPKEAIDFQAGFAIKDAAKEVKWVVDETLPWKTVLDTFQWYVKRASAKGDEVPYFVLMPEGCPPREEMVIRTLAFLSKLEKWQQPFFRYGDRIQYRISVR